MVFCSTRQGFAGVSGDHWGLMKAAKPVSRQQSAGNAASRLRSSRFIPAYTSKMRIVGSSCLCRIVSGEKIYNEPVGVEKPLHGRGC
jgi:hypothetical protein